MRLRAIELEGFRSFREHERVDLTGINLAVIEGENHQGKCLPGHVRVYDPDLGAAGALDRLDEVS